MYPTDLLVLIEQLKKLPGVGEKTAERLAIFVTTQMNKDEVYKMSEALNSVKDNLRLCKISHVITDGEISKIVLDEKRDHSTIMVVADSKDVFMMEKMQTYYGQYHVLGGLIDFSRGITHEDLNVDTLKLRINENVTEIIIATNGTVEGELTAQYIKALFEEEDILISRLAYGLPVGSDLSYADTLTLTKAVENRQKY
ncbi:MAG TPA: recombination protein RecR [Acholeplasmataceae bacterium]|nr:recombination protein RecR [Acholeplasmataceae bacterium]